MQLFRKLFLVISVLGLFNTLFAQATTDFIHVDQFGYRNFDKKVATISNPITGYNANESFEPGATYQIRKVSDNATVHTGDITQWNGGTEDTQSGDKAWIFDFSSVTTDGEYYVFDATNNVKSYAFTIGQEVYKDVLKQAFRTFFYQRCGVSKASPYAESNWTDTQCHRGNNQDTECRLVTDPDNVATAKDLSGGWHDAGDYNKYVNYAFGPVHDLLTAYEKNPIIWTDDMNIPESGNGIPDILDEVKWELDWLLKMQQADGSVLMKVSVDEDQNESPPSADGTARYYGPAQASATRTACSLFAQAAIIYKSIGMTDYANTLEAKSKLSWDWIKANPSFSSYGNTGFNSSNPERNTYTQFATKWTAAVYLFALTNEPAYRDTVDARYEDIHAVKWTFWYPFESEFQDALLYYAASANATQSVKDAILANYRSSVKTENAELYKAYEAFTSPYRAYVSTENYVWGSNRVKAQTSFLFADMIPFGNDPDNNSDYIDAAESYVHYLHGVNPQNIVYLSNMNNHGSEKSCNEIYHAWFADGSDYDNAQTSTYGPAPGFVPGGPNKGFNPTTDETISPPEGQPAEKAYKDWNTSYPEDSWEITEPADGYQAAYIRMLSQFLLPSEPLPVVMLEPLQAKRVPGGVMLSWSTAMEVNNVGFEIQRSDDGARFGKIDFITPLTNDGEKHYRVLDGSPLSENYYRFKQIDLDGHAHFSNKVYAQYTDDEFVVVPNPIKNGLLQIDSKLQQGGQAYLFIQDVSGHNVWTQALGYLPKGHYQLSQKVNLLPGIYYAKLMLAGQQVFVGKVVVGPTPH